MCSRRSRTRGPSDHGAYPRAAGAGKRVLFLQFDKGFDPARGEHYAERKILRKIPEITVFPTGCERMRADGTFRFGVEPEDLAESARGLAEARRAVASKDFDLVILDEALGALAYGLLQEDEIVSVLDAYDAVRQGVPPLCIYLPRGRETKGVSCVRRPMADLSGRR